MFDWFNRNWKWLATSAAAIVLGFTAWWFWETISTATSNGITSIMGHLPTILIGLVVGLIIVDQWLAYRNQTKSRFSVLNSFITGGVIIVAVELILTFGGAILISYQETSPEAVRESIANLTIFNEDPWRFNWSQLWLILGLVYTGLSFRFDLTVKADQIAVRTLFDRPTDTLSSGLPVVPPGIFQLILLPTLVQQREFPAEPELIFRGELKDRDLLPDGIKPPYRVTFTQSISEEQAKKLFGEEFQITEVGEDGLERPLKFEADVPSDGISKQRVTAEVTPVVRWRIVDGIAFVKNIGSIDEANRQLEDELFSVLTRIYTRISLAQAQNNISWTNGILYRAAERRIEGASSGRDKSWGIDLEGAFVKAIPVHHDLNEAIGNAAEADYRGRERERLAETDRVEREKRGLGDAAAARALLEARGEGYHSIAQKTRIQGGSDAMRTEAARELAASGNTVFADAKGGIGELLSLVGGAAAVAKRKPTSGGTTSADETPPSNEGESS